MTKRASVAAILLVSVVAACSAPAGEPKKLPPADVRAAGLSGFGGMDGLIAAARKEGELTVIGLPHTWVNYGHLIERFSEEYGIKVTELRPDANSQQQIAAVAEKTPPDVFDLNLDVAVANADKFAPYKVTGWQDIPDDLKEGRGLWYAAYGGYMSIGYDPRKMSAPPSYAALRKQGITVALPGDPLRSASAFNGVMATSLRRGKPDAARGVEFFAGLKKARALTAPEQATAVVDWDYLNLARSAATTQNGKPTWLVTIPHDAALASYYVQAINKKARHPAAARLWQEFLLSDDGQNLFLRGYARPVRMEAMQMRDTIDRDAARKLPKAVGTPVMLTIPEQDAAKSYLQQHWARQIG
ncbi:ABC transporter substrate-binding protein [Microtetraspora sp. NBRC 16547]|uniref:ABC transporter substrate-binding protein n=1 Tax=Microtetraspora sp. NBRC 16547 TaxID=3030993 RepID=UPI0024A334BE|nr:ABC transporter substrate-binding protein [Microtetraspora sp. NBRC 16547]GLW97717.1 ABC transporter substrate-binding protein [Microtetraspora sp. NBRC 16547]